MHAVGAAQSSPVKPQDALGGEEHLDFLPLSMRDPIGIGFGEITREVTSASGTVVGSARSWPPWLSLGGELRRGSCVCGEVGQNRLVHGHDAKILFSALAGRAAVTPSSSVSSLRARLTRSCVVDGRLVAKRRHRR